MEDNKVALILNTVFSNMAISLNIPKFEKCNPLSHRLSQPTLELYLSIQTILALVLSKYTIEPVTSFSFPQLKKKI